VAGTPLREDVAVSAFERQAIARLIERAERAGVDVPDVARAAAAGCGRGNIAAIRFAELYPDADPVGCCYGEAHDGPAGCVCWVPEYDVDQADPRPADVTASGLEVRAGGRCGDCAYRPDSPENADPWTAEELVNLAASGEPFWCHDGMRRPARWRHPRRDVVIEGPSDDWQPAMVGGVPFRADGSPAFLCAGWAGEGRRQERLLARELGEL
jgi:hypothetical protein